jgi:hypothetical protein
MPVLAFYVTEGRPLVLVCSGLMFLAIPIIHTVFTRDDAKALTQALAMTSMLLFLQALAFGFIWLL